MKVKYIKNAHPMKIWDVREVNEKKAQYLVKMWLAEIYSEDTITKSLKKWTKKLKNAVKKIFK